MSLAGNLLYFILFSVVATCIYRVLPRKYRVTYLLLTNIAFYVICCGWYVAFILFSGLWSFLSAQRIERTRDKALQWLWAGIVPLVLILCTFKYWVPLTGILARIWNSSDGISAIRLILPLGMSYYILKSISYMCDVYFGKITAETSLVKYLAYVSFFAQIIAGPIQRYSQWHEELEKEQPSRSIEDGYYHIVRGLFMKVVIANRLATYVTTVMVSPETSSGLQLWMTFFLYAVYIYCDFAGYSHIAIGVTNMFGLDCIDNFKTPYLSANAKEFWGRWHISLSSWLKDYIYIPLGGNRKGPFRKAVNIMITFLVSGIWHGSTLNFVVWGGYHGVLNMCAGKKSANDSRLKVITSTLVTFLLVAFGWIFFATPDMNAAAHYITGMFTRLSINMAGIQDAILPFTSRNDCIAYFAVVMAFIILGAIKELIERYNTVKVGKAVSFVWQVFLLTSVLLFGQFGNTSFIYAGF